jgi:hypothetical protein
MTRMLEHWEPPTVYCNYLRRCLFASTARASRVHDLQIVALREIRRV